MSRIGRMLVLWFAVATVGCITAQAQNCGDWLKVTAWTGTYTLTVTGTFSSNGVTLSHSAKFTLVVD